MSTQGEDDLPPRGRPKSGSASTQCLTRSLVDGYPVTLWNTRAKLIIKLDDDAIRFVSTAFIDLVTPQLQVDGIDVEPGRTLHEEQSEFRFKEETPVQWGKVQWDVINDAWKVMYKNIDKEPCTAANDADGNSFTLPDGLDPAERRRYKLDRYKAACATWNVLDKSSRHRIDVLPGTTMIRRPEMPDA